MGLYLGWLPVAFGTAAGVAEVGVGHPGRLQDFAPDHVLEAVAGHVGDGRGE